VCQAPSTVGLLLWAQLLQILLSFAAAVAVQAGAPWPSRLSLRTCRTGRGPEPEQGGASGKPLAH